MLRKNMSYEKKVRSSLYIFLFVILFDVDSKQFI